MNPMGQRKAALYLASLGVAEQRAILAALPPEAVRSLRPLIAQVVAQGWADPELVGRALAEEIRGLTSQSSLSIDAVLALAKVLPADWTARLLTANTAMDGSFLLALLDTPLAKRVQAEQAHVPRLPERLKDALLAEAAASVRTAA